MILLLVFFGLTSAFQAFPQGGPPSFSIPPQALEDLRRLQNDPSLTKQQIDEAMAQWAEEYGFTKQYEAYKKLIEEQKLAAEREFDEAVQNLPFIIGELRQIGDDQNLTALQSSQREMEIINRLTPKQQQLLKCAGHIFAPAYLQPKPGPNGPGVFRPGPFGPGPYGPSPFRPGPYGPGPNGPGPYGPGPYGPGPYGPDPYGLGPRGPGPYPRPRPGPHGPGPWGPRGPRGF